MAKSDLSWLKYASLGMEFALTVLLFAFFGYQADLFFKIKPWGMFWGVIIGAILGFWNVYKTSMDLLK